MFTGLIVGAIIRYAGSTNHITHINVNPEPGTTYNLSVPPDMLRFHFPASLPITPGGNYSFYNTDHELGTV